MRPLKRLVKSDGFRRAVSAVAAFYIRLVRWTGRWETVNEQSPRRFWDEGRPFIVAFWHGRLLMLAHAWPRDVRPLQMLSSRHSDGQLIAATVGRFGIRTIWGSKNKDGSAAMRAMVRTLKDGGCVGITPDGPRGPRMRASPGVVAIARLSGAPVIPIAFGATRGRVLNSWDRFLVAWPFARGVFVWGEPIEVPRDGDEAAMERARLAIEDGLNAVTRRADALTGRAPAQAAPAEGERSAQP